MFLPGCSQPKEGSKELQQLRGVSKEEIIWWWRDMSMSLKTITWQGTDRQTEGRVWLTGRKHWHCRPIFRHLNLHPRTTDAHETYAYKNRQIRPFNFITFDLQMERGLPKDNLTKNLEKEERGRSHGMKPNRWPKTQWAGESVHCTKEDRQGNFITQIPSPTFPLRDHCRQEWVAPRSCNLQYTLGALQLLPCRIWFYKV